MDFSENFVIGELQDASQVIGLTRAVLASYERTYRNGSKIRDRSFFTPIP